jgi:hypothetical protein
MKFKMSTVRYTTYLQQNLKLQYESKIYEKHFDHDCFLLCSLLSCFKSIELYQLLVDIILRYHLRVDICILFRCEEIYKKDHHQELQPSFLIEA